ncbi:MAG: RNA polymerase sigma factor [Bacteroidota bacterium]
MDHKQFRGFILEMTDPLYRFALWRIGNREDAKDAVQDTFARLWQKRRKLSQYEKPEALAFKVLRNLCIDRQRKQTINTVAWPDYEPHIPDRITPQKRMELQEEVQNVMLNIKRLPEPQQSIYYLRHIDGMEVVEIADLLDLKVNTIHAHLSRTRKKLRSLKSKYYGSE